MRGFGIADAHANSKTGLHEDCQVMIDKLAAVPSNKIHATIGHLDDMTMHRVDRAIKIWLGLETPHLSS